MTVKRHSSKRAQRKRKGTPAQYPPPQSPQVAPHESGIRAEKERNKALLAGENPPLAKASGRTQYDDLELHELAALVEQAEAEAKAKGTDGENA